MPVSSTKYPVFVFVWCFHSQDEIEDDGDDGTLTIKHPVATTYLDETGTKSVESADNHDHGNNDNDNDNDNPTSDDGLDEDPEAELAGGEGRLSRWKPHARPKTKSINLRVRTRSTQDRAVYTALSESAPVAVRESTRLLAHRSRSVSEGTHSISADGGDYHAVADDDATVLPPPQES